MDSKLYGLIGKAVENAEKNDGDYTSKNLKYVWTLASNIASQTGVDENDLFVEGVIAMKKCEQKYDPSLNDNFVKYCAPSVRGYMLNVVNRQQDIVHIPVNHKRGFKKGQSDNSDVSQISYDHIDSYDYDTLGFVEHDSVKNDRQEILYQGLQQLDENGRIAIKMKLRLDEYSTLDKVNMGIIAQELEVPVNIANKIYKEALNKLSKYCQSEMK